MKTILRIFAFSFWVALLGFWPGDGMAQTGALGPCALPSPGNILGLLPGGAAARAAIIKRTILCLKATGQAPATGAPATGGRFVMIDPPGSTGTTPSGITGDGTSTGSYTDASGVPHGLLRTPTGRFTTFDPPGSTFTQPTSISPTGEIAGAYCDAAACHGFVRASNGTFTAFDPPGTMSFSIYIPGGPPPSINPAGAVAGTYFDASGEHGFLRASNGALTTIDVPGTQGFTEAIAMNPAGSIVGDFVTRRPVPRASYALPAGASPRLTSRSRAALRRW